MTGLYRILVTSSRDWADEQELRLALIHAAVPYLRRGVVVVHGACPTGGDAMADEWAAHYGVPAERHPADWDRFGRAAGPRRNAEMVAMGADTCLAFIMPCTRPACAGKPAHGSHGATGCALLARQAGIPVRPFGTVPLLAAV